MHRLGVALRASREEVHKLRALLCAQELRTTEIAALCGNLWRQHAAVATGAMDRATVYAESFANISRTNLVLFDRGILSTLLADQTSPSQSGEGGRESQTGVFVTAGDELDVSAFISTPSACEDGCNAQVASCQVACQANVAAIKGDEHEFVTAGPVIDTCVGSCDTAGDKQTASHQLACHANGVRAAGVSHGLTSSPSTSTEPYVSDAKVALPRHYALGDLLSEQSTVLTATSEGRNGYCFTNVGVATDD